MKMEVENLCRIYKREKLGEYNMNNLNEDKELLKKIYSIYSFMLIGVLIFSKRLIYIIFSKNNKLEPNFVISKNY
jgi:hypothetical protein